MSIDNLPLEITQDIFTLCCRRVVIRVPRLKGYMPRNIATQETISLVCSKWRKIALGTSELWNSATVMFCAFQGVDLDHALENVRAWLDRAGTSSISLSIIAFGAEEPHVRKIRQALLSYQIRRLDLQSIGAFLVPSDTSCHLKSLSLTYELSEPGRVKRVEFPNLPSLPSLKVLRLFFHPYDFTDHRNLYTIPWHQLSIFDNSHTYWPSRICLHILRQCQSLVQCTFWMLVTQEQVQSEVEDDIILPNLEILSLNFDWRGSVDHILRRLILPNIKSLDLISRGSKIKIPLDPTVIELMARRSGFKRLTTFAMPNTSNPVRIGSLLRYMPVLQSIELCGPVTFDERTFHDLSLGIIGPHLEEIQFKGLNEVEIVLMLRAIRERHVYAMAPGPSHIKPFKSVVLYCSRDSDVKTLGKEAERCSEELQIRVTVVSSVVF
ncbi:hypothetical protein JOM56_005197 [Amanita muscaria]